MDFSTLNEDQRRVVNTLPGPLFVSAGAGSGKTFTLKLRTANALLPNDSGFKLDSIEEVLAITFTKKAAAELLSRIKDTLIAEGLEDQALLADNAWISTIHGMAERLLRENALEIGLDPEFQAISEVEEKDLREQARASVVELVHEGEIDLSSVDWNWKLFGQGQYTKGLLDDAAVFVSKARAMPKGFEAYSAVPPAVEPKRVIERMVALGHVFLEYTGEWEKVHAKNEQPYIDMMKEAIVYAEKWLGSSSAELDFFDEDFDAQEFREMLYSFPAPSPSFGKKKAGEEFFSEYKREYAKLGCEVDGVLSGQAVDAAAEIARAIESEYAALKRESNVIDNNDMLHLCLNAFECNPGLAERYRYKFKLIMVDEFQDTDKVQIEILRHLAAPDFANVCVVGDAQQSIYRFRGADVGAFTDYRDQLIEKYPDVSEEALLPKLAENYRSHSDILAFVDSIFGQEQAFGENYLKLAPKGAINADIDPVMDERARVSLNVIHYKKGGSGNSKREALRQSAANIAKHFASIKRKYEEEGVAQRQSFALLLGVTNNAQIYIDALRREGLESMMTSGSILSSSKEAKTIQALVKYALNTADEQSLLDILTSDLFSISDDVLLAISYYEQDGHKRHRGLSRGFKSIGDDNSSGLSDADAKALSVAQDALKRFVRNARRGRVSEAIRTLFIESGVLDRAKERGVDGLAMAGNFAKTLDMLTSVEKGCSGIAEVARAFDAELEGAKESPGILSTSEADFVQIMTIHGSKGLQFDHVALADYKVANSFRHKGIIVENSGDRIFAISCDGMKMPDYLEKIIDEDTKRGRYRDLASATTPGEVYVTLKNVAKAQEAAEARRLLYVGLTRAVKSLFVSYKTHSSPNPAKKEPYSSDGIFKDVHTALGWDAADASFRDVESCTYGGSRAADVRFSVIDADADDSVAAELDPSTEDGLMEDVLTSDLECAQYGELTLEDPAGAVQEPFIVPVRNQAQMPVQIPFASQRKDVHSYTSLSSEKHAELAAEPITKPVVESQLIADLGDGNYAEESSFDSLALVREVGEDATALGTAFHHLAQLSIIERARSGKFDISSESGKSGKLGELSESSKVKLLLCPSELQIDAQIGKLDLTDAQIARLRQALENWFSSATLQELSQYEEIHAEVPFMVSIDCEDDAFFLEGEIDALATSDGAHAFLIDYKTGGRASESVDAIQDKHRFQAQCYAYALLRNGYESVKATFVRVEHVVRSASESASSHDIQKVEYEFGIADLAQLELEIIEARKVSL